METNIAVLVTPHEADREPAAQLATCGLVASAAAAEPPADTQDIFFLGGPRPVKLRLHILIEAGYPLPLAERIARSEADLHRAVELVDQGCSHKTAAEILL